MGRSRLSSPLTWWARQSGPTRYRLYSLWTLQVSLIAVEIVLLVQADSWWARAGIVVAGLAAALSLHVRPVLRGHPPTHRARVITTGAAVVLVSVTAVAAIVSRIGEAPAAVGTSDAAVTGRVALMLFALAVGAFAAHPWWLLAAVAAAYGLAFGRDLPTILALGVSQLLAGAFMTALMLLTLWGLRILDELERRGDIEARLRVAEERLRFSRDLHDVVGRSFSAISVKSELARSLLSRGATERAGAELDEIAALAAESMDQMRTLVRGYRDIDLANEVRGARSLLSSAGCTLTVVGDVSDVPAHAHEPAAWLVREGTTNIVKHSSATAAVLELRNDGIRLSNNGVHRLGARTGGTTPSGLVGLAERLQAVGATVTTEADGDEFVVTVEWPTPVDRRQE
ncbi:hypothetical protein Rrhod_4276 [Rhodococcus rhodnii LMG 5362]|uniref:Signal transduction histidine kinase subgroup 3 dimerisation and phosphoacceptor domain-containing protein n=1 Tax=Rhodococcus rhodnii LMG 5362 TaxID=1273125 RepID=R7WH91_9NOCA|nr:hypothetical protein Rrhod_4276 [Rhodococcus rhodnii LMG 5362]